MSQEICNYWVIRETLLFQTRLNYILPRQLYRLFKSILYQLGELKDKKGLINRTLIDICSFFSKPLVFKHIVSKNHTGDCDFHKTKGIHTHTHTHTHIYIYIYRSTYISNLMT